MTEPADLSPTIIEALYCEALELADETRFSFELSDVAGPGSGQVMEESGLGLIAQSSEALRTTTRMMHAIAWLLNQRAYLAGELTESQLHRNGRLPPAPPADDAHIAMLAPELRDLTDRTERFYARVERLDHAWHDRFATQPAAVHLLRQRLSHAVEMF